MWSPGEDDLRTGLFLELIDGDQVGESLARMDSGRFKADDGLAGIFDELAEDCLRVIIFTILQAGEFDYSGSQA